MTTTIKIFGAALLVSLALASVCQAKEAVQQQQHVQPSLASKLIPQPQQPKARSARSLSDMFEKVKSKIFGNRKQQASQASSSSSSSSSVLPSSSSSSTAGANNQLQTSASINSAQRQPWTDLSSFSQQYNPYTMNYQWPAAGSSASGSNQFMMNPSYNSLGGFSMAPSSVGGLDTSASQQMGSSLTPAANSNQAGQSSGATGAGSLLTSASHLIAHYLSPSSSSSSSSSLSSPSSSIGIGGSPQQSGLFNGQQSGQSINNGVQLTPQQQQAQAQYQEFASILDTMVSQTGANVQQRPQQQPSINQYMQPQQQQQPQQQPGGANPMQSSGAAVMGNGPAVDNDMSGSSNIQSYMPQASQQPASQKSGMVGLAEQLSPGSQFNKLVSFPFSLTSNDDPSKDGRFKLHIPFLNNHVKRSDQQAAAAAAAVAAQQQQTAQLSSQQKAQQQQQQQFQQYMNNYYSQQQQLYASPVVGQQQQQPQQMSAQASQVVPTIVSPQTSSSSQQSPVSAAGAQISQSPSSSIQSSPSSSSSSGVPSSSSSSSSSSIQSSPNQSSSSLVPVGQSSNSRPAWSVSEVQSGSPSMSSSSSISSVSSSSSSGSSSKLIPIQSSAIPASSSIEQNTQN